MKKIRMYKEYYGRAGKASFENWHEVMKSQTCGCYYCQRIYHPSDISSEDYTMDEHGRTVLCPYCGIDAVIGDISGIPINEESLAELYVVMFS